MTNLHVIVNNIPTPKIKLAYSSTPQLSSNRIPIEDVFTVYYYPSNSLFIYLFIYPCIYHPSPIHLYCYHSIHYLQDTFWQSTGHPLHILLVLLALLTSYTNNPSLVSSYEKLVSSRPHYMVLFHFFLLGHRSLQIYQIKLVDTWLNSRQ